MQTLNYKIIKLQITITSAENGRLTAEMTVDKEHTNVGGTLHGAMSTYLVDSLSSLTLSTLPEVKNSGVSLNLHMSYVQYILLRHALLPHHICKYAMQHNSIAMSIYFDRFLKTAALGQQIEIISTVDKAGGKMAFMSVDIINKATGELVAKGSHTKFTAINRPQSEIKR